jgi:phage-related minor tail protein
MIRKYYTDMVDRATRTAAQVAVLMIGADTVNVVDVDWLQIAGFAAGGAVLSVLTTLGQKGLFGREPSA